MTGRMSVRSMVITGPSKVKVTRRSALSSHHNYGAVVAVAADVVVDAEAVGNRDDVG